MRRLAFLLIILSGLDLSLAPRVLFAQSAADSPFRFQGYFQTQYTAVSGDGRQTRDRIFFRRIVLAVQGDLADDWMGEVQVDIAPQTVGDRLIVRDTFIRYTGFEDRGIVVTLGNQKMPFSRSSYTSASRRAKRGR